MSEAKVSKANFIGVGVGFKPQHFVDICETQPKIDFFEVHAENYMGDGGLPHKILSSLAEKYDLSVHGVGMSIGSLGELDKEHLNRYKKVVDRYKPTLVSEHLAWSSHNELNNQRFLNDLLPVPYCDEVLDRVVEHIDQIQTVIRRQILIENPSTYVAFSASHMSEIEFISQMQQRTGCGLILDVNNVHISSTNQIMDAISYLDEFPVHAVQEIHLAGFAEDSDDAGDPLLIDAHDRPVAPKVWDLYKHLIANTGPVSTLIEWDNDVPDWDTLYTEAVSARRAINQHGFGESQVYAA